MERYTSILLLASLQLSNAFQLPTRISNPGNARTPFSERIVQAPNGRLIASYASSGDGELNSGPGMEDAFRELEALRSLGDEGRPAEQPVEKDEAFAKAMEELDLKDILSQAGTVDGEELSAEVELYKDMASELDVAASQEELIAADFKSDLEMAGGDGSLPKIDTQQFMDKAIEEALKEAKEQNSDVDVQAAKESFLDNKELMVEIEKIFDKANDDLIAELEEIRVEQELLAKQQAERNSLANAEKTEDYEKRMEIAQANMRKMLDKVNQETKNVEDAIEDLRRAQAESEGGIDSQLVDLKSGGLVKQATLAGALLFTLRGGIETIAFLSGDPSHALPALIQGAIAIACIVGFIFL